MMMIRIARYNTMAAMLSPRAMRPFCVAAAVFPFASSVFACMAMRKGGKPCSLYLYKLAHKQFLLKYEYHSHVTLTD